MNTITLPRQDDWHFDEEYGGLDYAGAVVLDIGADYGCTAEFFLERGAEFVFASEKKPHWRERLQGWASGKSVRLLPALDHTNAATLFGIAKPDLVKVDCEGCEAHLLTLPDEILGRPRGWVMETHTPPLWAAFRDRFLACGYALRIVKDFGPEPSPSGKTCKIIQATRP